VTVLDPLEIDDLVRILDIDLIKSSRIHLLKFLMYFRKRESLMMN